MVLFKVFFLLIFVVLNCEKGIEKVIIFGLIVWIIIIFFGLDGISFCDMMFFLLVVLLLFWRFCLLFFVVLFDVDWVVVLCFWDDRVDCDEEYCVCEEWERDWWWFKVVGWRFGLMMWGWVGSFWKVVGFEKFSDGVGGGGFW